MRHRAAMAFLAVAERRPPADALTPEMIRDVMDWLAAASPPIGPRMCTCGTCKGSGRVPRLYDDRMKRPEHVRGMFTEEICSTCGGAGVVRDTAPVHETPPAGP